MVTGESLLVEFRWRGKGLGEDDDRPIRNVICSSATVHLSPCFHHSLLNSSEIPENHTWGNEGYRRL